MERARTLGGAGWRQYRTAGQRRRISRLAHAGHGLDAEPHRRSGRVYSARWPRALAVERARLLAVAQPVEQLRQRQFWPNHRNARVVAGFGAVARDWRKLR